MSGRGGRSWSILGLLALLLLAGCGPAATPAQPLATAPPAATAEPTAVPIVPALSISPLPTPEPAAGLSISPLATPIATTAPEELPLVVLHSNDNWGETEPRG